MGPSESVGTAAEAGEHVTAKARVSGFADEFTVWLALAEPSRCGGCAGMCLRSRARPASLRISSTAALRPDDLVTVTIHRRLLLLAACLLHGLPWMGLVAGAAAGDAWPGGDAGTLLGAFSGLVLGAFLARRGGAGWRVRPVTVGRCRW